MLKKAVILFFMLFIFTGCKVSESKKIHTYEASEVCFKEFNETVDDETLISRNNVFITYDDKLIVDKALYQSISPLNAISSYTYETYDYIKRIYSNINGISVEYYETTDSLVFEVSYDYNVIDLDSFRTNVGELLDDKGLLGSVDFIPVDLNTFKSIELDDYECEVK